MQTLLIKIPQNNEKTSAAFEEVLGQVHESLRGKKVALEMSARGQNIAFAFTADEATAEVVAGQIYAMAPGAEIEQIRDFTQELGENAQFVSSEISLDRSDLFPLRNYTEFEGDSLAGVLSVLSKCATDEGAWLQLVIRPQADSSMYHLWLKVRRFFERIRHFFRIKYWFKKETGHNFAQEMSDKSNARGFSASLRVGAYSANPSHSPEVRLQAVLGALQNFNTLDLNRLKLGRVRQGGLASFQHRTLGKGFRLSSREIATLFHLPNEREVPNILHVLSKKGEPPVDLPTDKNDPNISFFGMTNFHGQHTPFGIAREDRRRHFYCVGKSGSGKSKLLELLIQNDIRNGHGVAVLDPHGDLVDNILDMIPENRVKDVIVFDPSDLEFPVSFNPLEEVPPELKIRVTIGFIEIFKKIFGANWTPRLEHVLRYTTLALLDTPDTTILSILQMLTDKNYRQKVVKNIQDNVVKNFWVNEFAGWSEKFDNEAITPLLNKVGQFVSTNMIRNIVGQTENKIKFREIMDGQKILLMKISKGILGEENAQLLGAMAVTKIYQGAMSRADTREEQRKDFYFYVDEFQNFATDTFDEILSEARKYRLNLTLAHQFLGQLPHNIRTTVFGNVGSMLSFRVSGEDGKILAEEFNPRFNERDIINLGVREFYVKMSIYGELREAFSARTLDMRVPEKSFAKECIAHSRKTYARPVKQVEAILDGTMPDLDKEQDFNEPIV